MSMRLSGIASGFTSKAGAMQFSINLTSTYDINGTVTVNYEEAKKLYDFICENVVFQEEKMNLVMDEAIEALKALKNKAGDHSSLEDLIRKMEDEQKSLSEYMLSEDPPEN